MAEFTPNLPKFIEIEKGKQATMTVTYASESNKLLSTTKLNLRLGSSSAQQLSVSITNNADNATVAINTVGTLVGEYNLVLETYDSSSSSKDTLAI